MVNPSDQKPLATLGLFLGVILAGIYLLVLTGAVGLLAQSFPYENFNDRPIVLVVCVSWLASAASIFAIYIGLLISGWQKRILGLVVLFAIAFRLILLFSNPILEVDYYRYLWDGVAANQGVSPYKFSPKSILESQSDDEELTKLQNLIAQNPNLHSIVSRVHFEEYTTLYPPVSQLVFRTTTNRIPDDASVETHITAIKFALILFDLGVIVCLGWMLVFMRKHTAWLIAYAWNPLVLKEISNGGHLDSIAIFFMTAGIGVFLWGITEKREAIDSKNETNSIKSKPFWWPALSGSLMGMGIGAKLFPVILLPALFMFLVVKKRWVNALVFGVSCAIVTPIVLLPMLGNSPTAAKPAVQEQQTAEQQQPTADQQAQQPTIEQQEQEQIDQQKTNDDGLTVFMTNWRMNDAIFSFVYQNVEFDWKENGPPWYVFVPNETRTKWCKQLATQKFANGNPAYFVARIVTVLLFGLFYLWVLYKLFHTENAEDLAGLLFLIMAIFFYLQPTQNPWYWLWAMPLVCFAKNQGWLFVSMILFVYYLRFWYTEQNPSYEFLGTTYVGFDFYDHCVVWIEFITVLATLYLFRPFKPVTPV